MGKLTTHVLDTAHGRPAAGMQLRLYRIEAAQRQLLCATHTNADGRCDAPLLQDTALQSGRYELEFEADQYFRPLLPQLPQPPFLDRVCLQFGIADSNAHYHVPLLVSPWSYSTYRGS